MKITCAYSGLEYKCDYIPFDSYSFGEVHPIFSIPQNKLLKLLPKWHSGELTEIDSYLLYLALFNSTELIRWSCPAKRTQQTASIVANNMEALVRIVTRIDTIKHPNFVLPEFAITPDTRNLFNSKYWIEIWHEKFKDFQAGLQAEKERDILLKKERALEKLIKNAQLSPEKYAKMLADWAATAGAFPEFYIKSPLTQANISLADYWKDIIVRCYRSESIIAIPETDLQELIEHAETNIEAGSIFSFQLFAALKEGRDRQKNFLGIDFSFSDSNPGFRILTPDTNIEDAAIQIIIDSAPIEEPQRKDYPTSFAYLKAKMKWDTKISYIRQQEMEEEKQSLRQAALEADAEEPASIEECEQLANGVEEIEDEYNEENL